MRIAYYLNDGTRKIGNAETFREDYDAGNVDASRQAAFEIKTDADLETFAQTRALTYRLAETRRAVACETCWRLLARIAPIASGLLVGAPLTLVFFGVAVNDVAAFEPFVVWFNETGRYWLPASVLSGLCLFPLWLAAKSAARGVSAKRFCELTRATWNLRAATLAQRQKDATAPR